VRFDCRLFLFPRSLSPCIILFSRNSCLPPESEKEDSYFFGSASAAMKLLGMSRPSQPSDSDDD